MRTIKERFDAASVNIPYPQRDLHLSGPIEVVLNDSQEQNVRKSVRPESDRTRVPPQSVAQPVEEPGPATKTLAWAATYSWIRQRIALGLRF